MRPVDRPLFEVVIPTTDPAERRLVTAETVRGLIGSPEADDAVLEQFIDGASAAAARYCNLARAGAAVPTFGRESLRATWRTTTCQRGPEIALPWRAPIGDITVTEDGVELTAGEDFVHLGAGVLQRLSDGAATCWSSGTIVVEYVAGWLLAVDASAYDGNTDPVPADIVNALVDQVRMQYRGRTRDPALMSRSTDEVGSESFAVAGGRAIDADGLLGPLKAALADYKKAGSA